MILGICEYFLNKQCRAAERCLKEKRKTLTGEDILFAMATLGFDQYIEPLKDFLTKYKEVLVYEVYS